MADLINLGELSKPATVLVEKISDAIGGVYKPHQIRRVAEAEATAKEIQAVADIKIEKLKHRALQRFLTEETIKQNNIENIIRKAIPDLNADAKPQDIEKDWIMNFFDKSKIVSDKSMQKLWSRILSGEGNAPGSFSKRTVNLMSSLDKTDALLFEKICNYIWHIGDAVPLIYDDKAKIYTKGGVTFTTLQHLDSIGLISYSGLTGYITTKLEKFKNVTYQKRSRLIEFPKEKDNEIQIGCVLLTAVGRELSTICKPQKIDGFFEYVLERWKSLGIKEHKANQIISK